MEKPKPKPKASRCFSCCVRATDVDLTAHEHRPRPENGAASPEANEGCWGAMSRAGKQPGNFKYDPLSYALNFDEGGEGEGRRRGFSARLPASPKGRTAKVAAAKEVVFR